MIKFIKKLNNKSKERKEKYWKLKQKDRIEYLLHANYIRDTTDKSLNFIMIPFMLIKFIFIFICFMLLTYIAIPSSKDVLLKLALILIPLFRKVIFMGFFAGFLIDMLNFYLNFKKHTSLNKRFNLE